jgi:hypothetical protein
MSRCLAVVAALVATLAVAQTNQTLLTVPNIPGSALTGRILVSGWSFVSAPGTAGTIKVSSLAITQADDESAPLLLKVRRLREPGDAADAGARDRQLDVDEQLGAEAGAHRAVDGSVHHRGLRVLHS